MAVRCRVGILKPFEQEIIMKGDQTVTIRRMLKDKQFARCFYGCYDEHPTGILCYRFSAYVLPGKVSEEAITEEKCVVNTKDGTKYLIDQIQINSEICRSISKLKDWIDYDLDAMAED